MGLEQFLDSECDGVGGGHEASAVLYSPEGIAEIRSLRQRSVRKRNFTTKKVTLIDSVISAAS